MLFGFINGANYACEEDCLNVGEYKFVDGKLRATFTETSYVAVKASDNSAWYMTDGWLGEADLAILYNTATMQIDANKLMVPGGVCVEFDLTDNGDGTLVLWYEVITNTDTDQPSTETPPAVTPPAEDGTESTTPSDKPNDTPSDETTGDAPDNTPEGTPDNTPEGNTGENEPAAPEDNGNDETPDAEEKFGCNSSVGAVSAVISLICILGMGAVFKKKAC